MEMSDASNTESCYCFYDDFSLTILVHEFLKHLTEQYNSGYRVSDRNWFKVGQEEFGSLLQGHDPLEHFQ